MIVSVEIPDQFARQFHLDQASHSGTLLEAFLLQRYAEGELTAAQVGEVLGLSFQETEQFLHDHRASGITPEENLEKLEYDLYYINHYSVKLDFSILAKTISVVTTMEGL